MTEVVLPDGEELPEPEPERQSVTVTVSERMNHDDLQAVLNAQVPGSSFSSAGAPLPDLDDKEVTAYDGVTEEQLLSAIDAAAAEFTDYEDNRAQILYNVETHADAMKQWVADNRLPKVLTPKQTDELVRLVNGLTALLSGDFETTAGT